MTRINLVHPTDLADQHLFAEWREIKMVPAKLRKICKDPKAELPLSNIPPSYTMSTGHVRFFYNKLGWLYLRFQSLTKELRNRNYKIPDDFTIGAYGIFLYNFPDVLVGKGWWEPSQNEIAINVQRITERLNQRPDWYRYYGEVKSPEFFINRYSQQLLVDTLSNSIV